MGEVCSSRDTLCVGSERIWQLAGLKASALRGLVTCFRPVPLEVNGLLSLTSPG